MRRFRFKKFVLPLIVLGALAAVGAASTNAIGTSGTAAAAQNLGYGAIPVAGNNISNVHYVTDAAGDTLNEVDVTFGTALLSSDVVTLSINGVDAAVGSCADDDAGADLVYACTGLDTPVNTLTAIDIAVTPGT